MPMIKAYVLEKRHHLIVGRVVRDEEADIGIVKDGGNADQASSATRHDSHVFPGVLALFALAMHLIVHPSNSGTERLDTSRGAILPSGDRDVDVSRTGE